MSRYRAAEGSEAQTEPGSHGRVLRNWLGIVRKRDMDRTEYAALVAAQERYLERITEETRFTATLLCEMHRDWLGGVYAWAGTYRSVEMQKGGFTWPPAHLVRQNMAAFQAEQLATHTPCRSASVEEVSRRIAEVHAELLLIHPFREGNGRLARWLADLMALQAGYPPPDYAFRGRGAKQIRALYLGAVQRGYLQDYDRLTVFFRAALERRQGTGGGAT